MATMTTIIEMRAPWISLLSTPRPIGSAAEYVGSGDRIVLLVPFGVPEGGSVPVAQVAFYRALG